MIATAAVTRVLALADPTAPAPAALKGMWELTSQLAHHTSLLKHYLRDSLQPLFGLSLDYRSSFHSYVNHLSILINAHIYVSGA